MPRHNNPFIKKTHELNEQERLKQKAAKAMNLEKHVEILKSHLTREKAFSEGLRESRDRLFNQANKYEWLREQELMLMTPDGVKYLKGDDLDAYIKEQTTPRLDLKEAALKDMTDRFSRALQAGMGTNKIMWTGNPDIDTFIYDTQGRISFHGGDTGKES